MPYAHQEISLSHQDHLMSHSMQPPPSPSIPIDPALSLYPPYYHSYPPQNQQHVPPHLSLPHNYSSPSSQGSDTIGTPPMYPSSANSNGKRPGSAVSNGTSKKARKDDDDEPQSPSADKEEGKAKPTRGSRACTVCRRLKMKCVGAEQGPPCKRCVAGNHECIFEESNRGKRSSKKHELLTRSLRKMERTLDTVLRSIGNPTHSPSPPLPSAPLNRNRPGSPKLHSLPDNSLNPLGLLAEASLANRRAHASHSSGIVARSTETKVGVASDNYFKPANSFVTGPISILPLRRLMIERQVQPEMLTFVSTDEVVALFQIFFEHVNMHASLLDPDFHTPSLVCSRSPFLLTTICAISSKFYEGNPELHPKLTEMAKKLAHISCSTYGCGAVERYEQDRTWLLLGMAIRMATDLNLHRKTALASEDTEDGRARDYEVHNRERTWLLFVIRNAQQWARAPVAIAADTGLAAYVVTNHSRSLDVLYSGTDSASGLIEHCDYLLVVKTLRRRSSLAAHWNSVAVANGDEVLLLQLTMLVLNSFGLQNALERSPLDIGHFLRGTSYAVLSLLKDVADVLENISANPLHTPALYSKFLRALISARLETPAPESKPARDAGDPAIQCDDTLRVGGQVDFHTERVPVRRRDGARCGYVDVPADDGATPTEDAMGSLTMDNILSNGFWTACSSLSPIHSGNNTPSRGGSQNVLTQMNINAAFRQQDGAKIDV
ncbi:hypothetical protein B0H13DRAFT_2241306 [Mycena leptocephala]|nr:hypothetical protein B0H13DRAFT_2241306 [Mycena leptocephala]